MTAPNTNYSEIIATSYEYRPDAVADAVTKHNAGLAWMKANGGWKLIDGGHKIVEPLQYAENGNGGWYSGAEELPVSPQEIISASEYAWKQIAVPIVSTGLELEVQNAGEAQVYDLLEERQKNAERTAANILSVGFFSDGTGFGGRQLTGLQAMIAKAPTAGTYGGIDRSVAANAFWRNKFTDTGADPSSTTIAGFLNTMWYSLLRGGDKPNVLITDSNVIGAYEAVLQPLQRFAAQDKAKLGFDTIGYKSADMVMDGNCTTKTCYFLNTDYMRFRVARRRNFKPLKTRQAYKQDVEVVILAGACNLTCSNAALLGGIEFAA